MSTRSSVSGSARSSRKTDFLADYDPAAFPPVAVTVDLIVLTIRADALNVLLVRRGVSPYRGRWALPGGFVRPSESLEQASQRELLEETSLDEAGGHLEQLRSYGNPGRDPRMRIITVAYLAMLPGIADPVAGSDARAARLHPVETVPRLAFDHDQILEDGLDRARSKLEYTSLATAFCGRAFSLGELRHVYELVWGVSLDPANFRRKVLGTKSFVVPVGELSKPNEGGGRPAELYRPGKATNLYPPILRPYS